ncbi:hypothetical protein ACWC5I_10620 [Kitasatospora sp. NPDC001574]
MISGTTAHPAAQQRRLPDRAFLTLAHQHLAAYLRPNTTEQGNQS